MSDNELITITVDIDRGQLVVAGDLDIATADVLDTAISEMRSAGVVDVTVDVTDVAFVDSLGLRVLLRSRTEGAVTLRGASSDLQRLLQLVGIKGRFSFID
jgi:anti-anti-sigma factor